MYLSVKADYDLLFHIMSMFSGNEIILSNLSLKKDIKLRWNNVMFGISNSHSYSKFFSCVDLIHLNEIPII